MSCSHERDSSGDFRFVFGTVHVGGQTSAKHLGTKFPNLGPLTTFKLKLVQSPNKLIR